MTVKLLTACIASNPLQAYLFGRLISSFAYWSEALRLSTSFLCIILLVVAVGVGLSYFTLGWVSNEVAVVSVAPLRLRCRFLTNLVYNHLLPQGVLHQHHQQASFILRPQQQLSRSSQRAARNRRGPAATAARDEYGYGIHIHFWTCRLCDYCRGLPLEVRSCGYRTISAHNPRRRLVSCATRSQVRIEKQHRVCRKRKVRDRSHQRYSHSCESDTGAHCLR